MTNTNSEKLVVGVEVVILDATNSMNRTGDIGLITQYDSSDDTFKVTVEGRFNKCNWMRRDQIAISN
jgi:hypothetical protein